MIQTNLKDALQLAQANLKDALQLAQTTLKNVIQPNEVHSTLKRRMLADGHPFVYDHRASHGSWFVDSITGREYLDLFSFFASSPLTYNHPLMHDPVFREKIADVALINPSNSDVYTVELAEFVQTLERVGTPSYMKHFFFVAGGAPAVENALKVAFDWKVRKNFAKGHTEERGHKIIHFKQAFHGRLGYSLSLTNTADPRKYIYYPRFQDWPRIDTPKMHFPQNAENILKVEEAEQQALAQIAQAFRQNPDDIAAIIIEPIQSEGGDNHFRPEFFAELRRIANEEEAFLIFDEIQTGVGLTGKFWAAEHTGIEPDIIVFGKKMQICGIMATDRVHEVERNVFVEHSRINSTWGGNLVDMVRGTRYLEIIEQENLVENANLQGQAFMQGLADIQKRGAKIDNLRGKGLMIAFDMPSHSTRDALIQKAFDNQMLLLACGERSIRLRPHLDIKREIVDEALNRMESLLCE